MKPLGNATSPYDSPEPMTTAGSCRACGKEGAVGYWSLLCQACKKARVVAWKKERKEGSQK